LEVGGPPRFVRDEGRVTAVKIERRIPSASVMFPELSAGMWMLEALDPREHERESFTGIELVRTLNDHGLTVRAAEGTVAYDYRLGVVAHPQQPRSVSLGDIVI